MYISVVNNKLLDHVTAKAINAPRLRQNHNIHPRDDSRCHRLLNAIEPGSYIRPHRHLDPEKDEAYILMRGRLGIILFNEAGDVIETLLLSREAGNLAADIPHGFFHAAVSLESGTVFYESKAGPYLPLAPGEAADWAPADTDPRASSYLQSLQALFGA